MKPPGEAVFENCVLSLLQFNSVRVGSLGFPVRECHSLIARSSHLSKMVPHGHIHQRSLWGP